MAEQAVDIKCEYADMRSSESAADSMACHICGANADESSPSKTRPVVRCRLCSGCVCHQECMFNRERNCNAYTGWTEFVIFGNWNCDSCVRPPIYPDTVVDEYDVIDKIEQSITLYADLATVHGGDCINTLMSRLGTSRKNGTRPHRPVIFILKLLFVVEDDSLFILELTAGAIADALLQNYMLHEVLPKGTALP